MKRKRKSPESMGIILLQTPELVSTIYDLMNNNIKPIEYSNVKNLDEIDFELSNINFAFDLNRDIKTKCLNSSRNKKVDIFIVTENQFKQWLKSTNRPLNSVYVKQMILDENSNLVDESYIHKDPEILTFIYLKPNLPKYDTSLGQKIIDINGNFCIFEFIFIGIIIIPISNFM